MEEVLNHLRYPIGAFKTPLDFSKSDIDNWIYDIEKFPSMCRNLVRDFSDEMLDDRYRPGGWTGRQVIHHIADSHMNALIRFKLALTEDNPVIRPYIENKWAELIDSKTASPEISLSLLDSLHHRWVLILKNMSKSDYLRTYFHPESNKEFELRNALAMYSWHGKHHLEHLRIIKQKSNS